MSGRKALVVEDDPRFRKVICGYLERMNWEVVTAADGRSAMRLLNDKSFDLVCLDLMLPDTSGYEVCNHLRRTVKRSTPILVVSGRTMPEDRAHADEMGADGYMIKPIKRAQFQQQVEEIMSRPPIVTGLRAI